MSIDIVFSPRSRKLSASMLPLMGRDRRTHWDEFMQIGGAALPSK
ncbi:hypothetical protein [Leptolyngbya sp. FACHB-36]|nr:hypothetical protein [Leptolyngbya sp. FACHB-36]